MSKVLGSFLTLFLVTFSLTLQAQMGASDADREAIVNEINQYRATESLPPLQRWVEGESCADQSAMKDSQIGQAHATYEDARKECGSGTVNFGQNALPGWNSLQEVKNYGVKAMWDEKFNPNGAQGHYQTMNSSKFRKVAIGVYRMPNGKYWVNMNFRD